MKHLDGDLYVHLGLWKKKKNKPHPDLKRGQNTKSHAAPRQCSMAEGV